MEGGIEGENVCVRKGREGMVEYGTWMEGGIEGECV